MTHQKREATSIGGDLTAKRSKCIDTDVEKRDNLDIGASLRKPSLEKNGEKRNISQLESNENQTPKDQYVSEETTASNSKVSSEQYRLYVSEETTASNSKVSSEQYRLTCIEADVAEDKGCRHTMEDASLVLPDASSESPGKLRCAHFAIYDGHGGRLAAEYAQKHLHQDVLAAGLPHGFKSCQESHN